VIEVIKSMGQVDQGNKKLEEIVRIVNDIG
jgi:hypothetical protein